MGMKKAEQNEKVLYIFLDGRIDSGNAAEVENDINEELGKHEYEDLVLDIEDLEYISSAGLRVVLRLRKNNPSLRVIGASVDVYEIFDMTGFTEMIPIDKAYRKLSVDGCEVIGRGGNGEVYRLDPDTIVKVYFDADALDDIHRERELARRAFVLGIPTAIPYDVVKVGDTYGSVFELLSADSLAKLIKKNPDNLDEYIGIYVGLLKKIHGTVVRPEDMPDMRDVAIGWAKFLIPYLPEETGSKLVSLMEAVPVDHHMMHGDYHIKNIMIQDGEEMLIDMDTLCQGNPVFELGSMFNAYLGFSELDHSIIEGFLGITHEVALEIWNRSLSMYLDTDDEEKIAEVEKKAKLVGYTRLMRRAIRRESDTEAGQKSIACYKQHILELTEELDTLVF